MKTNYMGMFRAMNVTYFLHKPKANNAWIERYEFMNLPVQLKLYLVMEVSSMQGDDWYSFLDVQGCYSKLYFVLKPFESCYGTSAAKQENENGDVAWECYRSCLRFGIASRDIVGCV